MLIDWFTVGAQVLNFVVLIWLLKRFLYKPILDAIDSREKHIVDGLAGAAEKQVEAQKERDKLREENEAFEAQRTGLLAKVAEQGKAEQQRLLDEAVKQADALRAQQAEAMRADRVRLESAIARLTQDEVLAIARKALTDLAAADLEERMAEVFTRRLRELDPATKDLLAAALAAAAEPALVRSGFVLSEQARAVIQNGLNETFSAAVRVRFETESDIVCGIEMTANGRKLGWSIAGYLGSLEEKLGSLVEAPAG